jgi:hypothetical protein
MPYRTGSWQSSGSLVNLSWTYLGLNRSAGKPEMAAENNEPPSGHASSYLVFHRLPDSPVSILADSY